MKKRTQKRTLSIILSIAVVLSMTLAGITRNTKDAQAEAIGISGGTTKETATTITTFNQEYIDTLETDAKEDWFTFTTPSYPSYIKISGTNFDVGNGYNLKTCLYSVYNEPLDTISIYKGESETMYIRISANSTYYLKFYSTSNNTGSYKFSVSFLEDSDGNQMSASTSINLDEKYEKNLAVSGDTDYFTFIAPTDGVYEVSQKNNNINGYFSVQILTTNSENLLTVSSYTNEDNTDYITLIANTVYYVYCYSYSSYSGNYSFKISTPTSTVEPTSEPTLTPTEEPAPIYTQAPTFVPTLSPEPIYTPDPTPDVNYTATPSGITTPAPTPTSNTIPDINTTSTPSGITVPTSTPQQTSGSTTYPPKTTATPNTSNKNPIIQENDSPNTTPSKITRLKLQAKKKALKATWNKASNANGYQIWIGTTKSFSLKMSKSTKKTTLTIKKLQSKRKYFVKVRAYKITEGKKIYGKWSKVTKVKTK